ncbi:MAG TPA: AAA family ATPase [Bacteroidia bacterium]|jgi:recombinational DNA repair ATPase RecF|nr:AAA family ATPase [Bacteroidia bacterium]
MKWITEIVLNNYRGFGEPKTITIPNGSHLLIYGENGSGKSSIYNGLKDFFSSSVAGSKTKYKLNKFLEAAGNTTGNVAIRVEETGVTPIDYNFALPDTASDHRKPEIILANKFKGFLDYKRMLKVHSFDVPEDTTPNIFQLLVEELLCEHKVADPKGGVTTIELLVEYKRLVEILTKTKSGLEAAPKSELQERLAAIEEEQENIKDESPELKKLPENLIAQSFALDEEKTSIVDALKIIDSKEQLAKLDASFKILLTRVISVANDFLRDHFKNKLLLDVSYSKLEYDDKVSSMKESLSLKIKYAGTEIEFYQAFLNEARISSLAICLYLASIKTYEPEADTLKILYLDDVFIGLDTNNRIPLLNILKKEFIEKGFQIFISSYDRQWFVTARHWFKNENCKFKSIELFINDDDGNPTTPDYPVLIDPSENYLQKAESHFASNDFPAAANYLRKACESELKRVLPRHLLLRMNNDEVEIITKLETLIDHFVIFMTKNNLNQTPFAHFKTYKKILFNPLSHDDLEAPHYRSEIRAGIIIVRELQKIKTKEIVLAKESAISPMKLGIFQNGTRLVHNYEITALENLQLIQQDLAPAQLSVVECEIKYGTLVRKFPTLNAAFDQLRIDRGYPASNVYTEFYTNISISANRKLIEAMAF